MASGNAQEAARRALEGLTQAGLQAEIPDGSGVGLSVEGHQLSVKAVGHGIRVKVPKYGTFIVMAEPGAADELRGLVWGARRFRNDERKRRGVGAVRATFDATVAFFSGAGITLKIERSATVAGTKLAPALMYRGEPVAGVVPKRNLIFMVTNPESRSPFRDVPTNPDRLCRVLVRRHFQRMALLAARRYLPDDGADITTDRSGRVAVMRRGKPVCVIDGVTAQVEGEPLVRGNFLTGGPHWDRLAEVRRRRAQANHRLTATPGDPTRRQQGQSAATCT